LAEKTSRTVALYLDVALLQDVEQADLHLAGQIGQLIDREDAAMGARQQSVVHRPHVAEFEAGFGGLDGIDVANQVGDGHVGCGQFLDVAVLAIEPRDGDGIAVAGDPLLAGAADG
jgi:hypothetical protein